MIRRPHHDRRSCVALISKYFQVIPNHPEDTAAKSRRGHGDGGCHYFKSMETVSFIGDAPEMQACANHAQTAVLNCRRDFRWLNIAFMALKKSFVNDSECTMTTAVPLPRGRRPVE